MATGHEFLPHTADVQVHAWAPTLEGLFKEIGLVLARFIVEGPDVAIEREVHVFTRSEDLKALLFDWLTEMLVYFDSELLVVADIDVLSLSGDVGDGFEINSVFKGETFKAGKHQPGTEVKAITYSYMDLGRRDDGSWHLLIIFDI